MCSGEFPRDLTARYFVSVHFGAWTAGWLTVMSDEIVFAQVYFGRESRNLLDLELWLLHHSFVWSVIFFDWLRNTYY